MRKFLTGLLAGALLLPLPVLAVTTLDPVVMPYDSTLTVTCPGYESAYWTSGRGQLRITCPPNPAPTPTPTPDPAPVISSITVSDITQTSATVSWHVSEVAQGQTEYGTTASYGSLTTKEESFDYQDHVQTISGLLPGTLYHFRVLAWDSAAQTAQSADGTFTTAGTAPTPPPADPCDTTVAPASSIQTALDAAASGDTVCLTADATYMTASALVVNQKTGVTLDGQGATVERTTLDGIQEIIYVRAGSDITVRDVNLVGSHPNPGTYAGEGAGLEFQAGVAFLGTQGGLVEAVAVSDNRGDGFYVGNWGETPARDITIRDSSVNGNGRQGVAIVHADTVLVERVTFANIAYWVFDLEPDGAPHGVQQTVENVTIQDNVVNGPVDRLFFGAGGYGPSRNVTVQDNLVTGSGNRGIWSLSEPRGGHRNSNISFLNNVGTTAFYEDPGWTGVILICDTDGATVTGNSNPVNNSMVGVRVVSSSSVTVSGNTFTGTSAQRVDGGYTCP